MDKTRVRFSAHYGLNADIELGPKSAMNGLMHRRKQQLYSITSSARAKHVGSEGLRLRFASGVAPQQRKGAADRGSASPDAVLVQLIRAGLTIAALKRSGFDNWKRPQWL